MRSYIQSAHLFWRQHLFAQLRNHIKIMVLEKLNSPSFVFSIACCPYPVTVFAALEFNTLLTLSLFLSPVNTKS